MISCVCAAPQPTYELIAEPLLGSNPIKYASPKHRPCPMYILYMPSTEMQQLPLQFQCCTHCTSWNHHNQRAISSVASSDIVGPTEHIIIPDLEHLLCSSPLLAVQTSRCMYIHFTLLGMICFELQFT